MDDNIYKINVSGKIYHIKHKTLIKIPYFKEYIDNFDETECFVERSSMIFDHVLTYVLDDKHPYPSKYFYELDFYGLTYNKDIYKVNMLGKIYHLKKDILMEIPYFVNRINEIKDSSVEIYVDRSPLLFDHVLAYVTMGNEHPYTLEYTKELDYYRIKWDAFLLNKDTISHISDEIYMLKSICYEIKNKSDDIMTIMTKLDKLNKSDDINVVRKKCEYDECENYFYDNDDYNGSYCPYHSNCRQCYREASRGDNYLCHIHYYPY